ncbi:MAG: manganese ABC transporter permease [Phycisphaerales bacterium]|nr:MAG: manganese ABC transporter permease [Phycisphaerales bacterium]
MAASVEPTGLVLRDVLDVLAFRAGYNANAVLLGCAMLGVACGVVGMLTLLRRRSLVADAVGHATLPGIVAAFLASAWLGGTGRSLPVLLLGAALSGWASVLAIFALLRWTRLREDAAIGSVLGVAFGLGVVLLSLAQDPANTAGASPAGLHHFIYGQTAAMRAGEAGFMAVLAAAAVVLTLACFKELMLTAFNEDYARVLGLPVGALDALALALLVVVTVAGLQAVGLILVIALLILPAASARLWTDRAVPMAVASGLLGGASGLVGAAVSAAVPRAPAGSVIVLTAGGVFAFSLLASPSKGVLAVGLARLRQRLRIAGEHLLEAAYEHRVSRSARRDVPVRSLRAMARLWGWPLWLGPIVLAHLRLRGELVRTAGGYALTDRGVQRGRRIARNHRLWEQYLQTYADVAPGHVDWSADMVEHVLSPQIVERLERAIERAGRSVEGPVPDGASDHQAGSATPAGHDAGPAGPLPDRPRGRKGQRP